MTDICCILSSFLLFDMVGFSIFLAIPNLKYYLEKEDEEVLRLFENIVETTGKEDKSPYKAYLAILFKVALFYLVSALLIMFDFLWYLLGSDQLLFYGQWLGYGISIGVTIFTLFVIYGINYVTQIQELKIEILKKIHNHKQKKI